MSQDPERSVLEPEKLDAEDLDTGLRGPRIRCPLCAWRPGPADTWSCSCGHEWNTFDTGGVCPSCLHQWLVTQCLSCHAYSAHSDWYDYQ